MKVILTENVSKVGKKYQIKDVAPGFGRNFLIARNLAKLATHDEVARLEKQKAQYEESLAKKHQELMTEIEKAGEVVLEIFARANAEGHLYAGLDAIAIAEAYKNKHGLELDSDWLMLESAIKEVGEKEIKIKKNPFAEDKNKQEFAILKIEVKAS